MSMRSATTVISRSSLHRMMEKASRTSVFPRYFSDGKGRVLSEEERAKETVYIQKMEKERLEKLKQKMPKEKPEKEKDAAEKKSGGEDH